MEGHILKQVDTFSAIHFTKGGKPQPVMKRGIQASGKDDGTLDDECLEMMLDSVQKTIGTVEPDVRRDVYEYTLTHDKESNVWHVQCYI